MTVEKLKELVEAYGNAAASEAWDRAEEDAGRTDDPRFMEAMNYTEAALQAVFDAIDELCGSNP